jgi:hypothetical protein
MAVGTTTSLPFKSIPVVNNVVLWEQNICLEQFNPLLEPESDDVWIVANKVNGETLTFGGRSNSPFLVSRHELE